MHCIVQEVWCPDGVSSVNAVKSDMSCLHETRLRVNLPQVNVSRVNTVLENKHGHKLNFSISIPNQTDKTTMSINYVMTLILLQCLRLKKDIVCGRSKGPNERTALSY